MGAHHTVTHRIHITLFAARRIEYKSSCEWRWRRSLLYSIPTHLPFVGDICFDGWGIHSMQAYVIDKHVHFTVYRQTFGCTQAVELQVLKVNIYRTLCTCKAHAHSQRTNICAASGPHCSANCVKYFHRTEWNVEKMRNV